jgi:hypothetical protein
MADPYMGGECPYRKGQWCQGCKANIAFKIEIFGETKLINCARIVTDLLNSQSESFKAHAYIHLLKIEPKVIENLIRKVLGEL